MSSQKNSHKIFVLGEILPFIFFLVLFIIYLDLPPLLSFDETHYIPAAKKLIQLQSNTNWEHPPLGKLILGLGWLIFNQWTEFLDEYSAFRVFPILFGLLTLLSFRLWISRLGFSKVMGQALMWTVGFNIIWFVQSKMAMLDVFYVCFGFWGLYGVIFSKPNFKKPWLDLGIWSWVCLALAVGCKWSVAPLIVVAFIHCIFAKEFWHYKRLLIGLCCFLLAYFCIFIPLWFLKEGPIEPWNFFQTQMQMLAGLASTSDRDHGYKSKWWQWPTLLRPMWYTFSKVEGSPIESNYTVFMVGNPLLFLIGNGALLYLLFTRMKSFLIEKVQDSPAKMLFILYFAPLLTWMIAPRKLMFFYYIFPSSFWYGPMIFLVFREIFSEKNLPKILWGYILMEAIVFFFFLPITSGQALSTEAFRRFYQMWMWKLNWI